MNRPSQSDSAFAHAIGDREPRLPVGTRIDGGRFEITEEIGRGGMAVVYRATELATSRVVAVKVANVSSQPAISAARMRNEARLGSSLGDHPNVVRAIAQGTLKGYASFFERPFVVTEFFDGQALDTALRGPLRGIGERRVCRIVRDVARALVALHEQGIVHRDVKPGNVLLGGDSGAEKTVLIDFGLAFATGDGWAPQSPELTREGLAPGTPLYMSPQQMAHQRPDPSFDIYSLGVMMYEMLAGGAPLDDVPDAEIVARRMDPSWRPYPLPKVRPELPSELTALVGRCMEREPKSRPSAGEVVRVLDRLLVEHRPHRTALWVGGGVAAATALGVVAWLVYLPPAPVAETVDGPPTRHAMTATAASPVVPPAPDESTQPRLTSPTPHAPRSPAKTPTTAPPQPASPPLPAPADPCLGTRARAKNAESASNWKRIVKLTAKRRCWQGHEPQRQRLRVHALLELHRYDECEAEAVGASDPTVVRLAAVCETKNTNSPK